MKNHQAFIGYVVGRCERDVFSYLGNSERTPKPTALNVKSVARELVLGKEIYDDMFGFNPTRTGEPDYRQLIESLREIDLVECEENETELKMLVGELGIKMHSIDDALKKDVDYTAFRHRESS
jgi:hypothetical protein